MKPQEYCEKIHDLIHQYIDEYGEVPVFDIDFEMDYSTNTLEKHEVFLWNQPEGFRDEVNR